MTHLVGITLEQLVAAGYVKFTCAVCGQDFFTREENPDKCIWCQEDDSEERDQS